MQRRYKIFTPPCTDEVIQRCAVSNGAGAEVEEGMVGEGGGGRGSSGPAVLCLPSLRKSDQFIIKAAEVIENFDTRVLRVARRRAGGYVCMRLAK